MESEERKGFAIAGRSHPVASRMSMTTPIPIFRIPESTAPSTLICENEPSSQLDVFFNDIDDYVLNFMRHSYFLDFSKGCFK